MAVVAMKGEWFADGPPTPHDVRRVAGDAPRPEALAALRDELERSRTRDAGHLVRAAVRAGLAVPRGVAGLPGPTARNWLRALLAHHDNGDVDAACRVEVNVELVPALGRVAGRRAAPPAPAPAAAARTPKPASSAAGSAEDLAQALALRFPGFPGVVAPGAAAAVECWEAATGERFPWPDDAAARVADLTGHPAPPPAPDVSPSDAQRLNAEHVERIAALTDELRTAERELTEARTDLERIRGKLADLDTPARVLAAAADGFSPSAKHEPQRVLHHAAVALLAALTGAGVTVP